MREYYLGFIALFYMLIFIYFLKVMEKNNLFVSHLTVTNMLTLDKNGNYKSSYQHNTDSEPARTVGTISSEQYDTYIEERLNYVLHRENTTN